MKPFLTVLVPSRGRPHTLPEMVEAFRATCTERTTTAITTQITFVVDEDDPTLEEYSQALYAMESYPADFDWMRWGNHNGPTVPVSPQMMVNTTAIGSMNAALNVAAMNITDPTGGDGQRPFAVGFMGDDHRPRTEGWDSRYMETLHELGTGIVYGDDRLQGAALPTQVAMTSDIIRALGHMAPPDQKHLYLDNYWLTLGQAANCIRYLPEVIVEHMHYSVGKSPADEHYHRVNSGEMYSHDEAAWRTYVADGRLERDAELVRSLRLAGI